MSDNSLPNSLLDRFIIQFDSVVRTVFGQASSSARPSPADKVAAADLTLPERRLSAALMRINHTGEVCAQALYQGQALTAHSRTVRYQMQTAAAEEVDHLAWCQQRLNELNSHTSYLNPLWYLGSLALGVTAGFISDRWSLGFVAETEHQVVQHLENHLQKLPINDIKSREIVTQMRQDEQQHATLARQVGASDLPVPIKAAMKMMSRCMTTITYWV